MSQLAYRWEMEVSFILAYVTYVENEKSKITFFGKCYKNTVEWIELKGGDL